MSRILFKILAALVAAFLLYNLWVLGHIIYWRDHNPGASSFMNEQLARLQQDDPEAELRHKWVPYDKISPNLKRALIASEDARFVDHEGFDWDGIEAAFEKNLKKGKIVAGGSTISQQLAKNLFLSSGKTPWRKLEEALITVMLETVLDKRRIYEIYLNVIEWGNGVFGAEAASRYYFRTGASRLSSSQAAKLAAMVPNPRYYDEHRNAPGLARKTRIIQRRMAYVELP
ncbi:monofunctional biosynthetic peptidoglycan transglycosylase [Chromobacterium violaceum]|uniref:Biosynthetic peptidoglycan transglycosylase n=1 Tax=Chromobacterium violaceum (strain ATCC 12472 / DSM 30191 / JCM 1249 / CCUG 213 / NBRC 12614 / NCIMB 9131 / NCTC 9757 / MK) TaxID=243365 RepID=MTGA_CHRVO|nr:monofunctional biosynthetic peptidoglycan transglycosylase [Chromobacterium violaceum]Q7NS41.1 RecName: Full=Biosynthetic peptidoglycan transglycosylase; AltName: Full=Glycan polymerase; AltName: Full=Peptidoglycan glycosyltransferase MtgA; Short=PGT [Chromobacterium violaceum ATCC 12472]AAQ61248.1 peptidoglycan glycosyltransferase [Chromobacterium violaceum ATCC 12472]ATP29869.1 monofunctional biosynthetic peptidoglycan transglycosylase [Chromobacterium violaceum]ATP33775.1 monofunctional b